MLAKLWPLVERLKFLTDKTTLLRLALAGVVLGVGGFAVYKGAMQVKPGRPTPKPTQTAANKLRSTGAGQADPQSGGEAEQHASDGSLYGDSLYPDQDANPALGQIGDQASANRGYDDSASGIPNSPMEQYAEGSEDQGQQLYESDGDTVRVRPSRIRNLPRAPSGSAGADQHEQEVVSAAQPGMVTDTAAQELDGSVDAGQYDEQPGGYGTASVQDIDVDARGAVMETEGATVVSPQVAQQVRPQRLPGIAQRQAEETGADVAAMGNPIHSLPVGSEAIGGMGVPGDRQFEGTQAPSVAIEKFAPAEIQVGKPATFQIRVRNAGQVAAHDVLVTDQVPQGTRLESTNPEAELAADGSLAWSLGEMQPGDEVVLSMQVMPEEEGEIGSVAHVTFAGRATARSVCTRPLLAVEHTAPKQVLIGETVRLGISVTNPGTGAATGVIVEEDVPAGLVHVAGSELEYEIGTLRPNETRQLELQLTADKPGVIENVVTVRGEGNLIAQHTVQIEVIAPQLEVAVSGPKVRYLERQATYTLSIANPGTAAARGVQLVAFLPKGMKFQGTDAEGQYDPSQHAVFWSLEELPANKSGSVNLTAIPVETGEQKLRVEGRADLGLTAASEQAVQVEAKSELVFNIVDVNDPIEVGTDTTYEIRVSNNGTRPATQVEVAAGFPEGGEIRPISADGHSRGQVTNNQVTFAPVGRINPGEEVTFRIQAKGTAKGDHVIAVQIRSAEFPQPVLREESTRVYADQ